MNLGAKPEFQTIANINLATPIGALLDLQGFGIGENPENPEVSFEAVLASANLENELPVESQKVSPHENSHISLEQTLGSIYPNSDDVIISSPQINSDTVVDSPKLVEASKAQESVSINYPSQVQEITSFEEPISNIFPREIETKEAELPAEVLKAVREFETENNFVVSEAQLNQAVAVSQPSIKPLSEKPAEFADANEEKNDDAFARDIGATLQSLQKEVVIPVKNNIAIKPKEIGRDSSKQDLTNSDSKLTIKTALPINIKDVEMVQNENFYSEIEKELISDFKEERLISKVTAEPKEVIVLSEKPREFLPIHKIAHYQEKGIPVENRSQNISHQVVKVLNNLETKTQSITVQLDPVDLGKIDIKMDISPKGETKVQILAEKLETYAFLTKATDQIQGILNDKGLSQDSTSLNFGLRHGNSNQQNNNQQFASANSGKEFIDQGSQEIEMKVAHLLYTDPNRLDITA